MLRICLRGAKKCRKPYKVSVSVDGDEYINVNGKCFRMAGMNDAL